MSRTISRASLLVIPILALSGCATMASCDPPKAPEQPQPEIRTVTKVVDTACQWVKPIYLDPKDVLSKATSDSIAAHDMMGVEKCGWKGLSK